MRQFEKIESNSVMIDSVQPVHFSPISSLMEGAKDGRFDYVVSSIANHWDIIADDPEKLFYHPIFEDQVDIVSNTNSGSITDIVRVVRFSCTD